VARSVTQRSALAPVSSTVRLVTTFVESGDSLT
jgi:hypothetical protein